MSGSALASIIAATPELVRAGDSGDVLKQEDAAATRAFLIGDRGRGYHVGHVRKAPHGRNVRRPAALNIQVSRLTCNSRRSAASRRRSGQPSDPISRLGVCEAKESA
jgi:hypothetical protein